MKAAKNDGNDALSTAIAGLRHCELRTVRRDDHSTVLRLLVGRYDDLVSLRTQATCRLHAVLRELVAGGAPLRLSADRAAKLLRSVRPDGLVGGERVGLPKIRLHDVRHSYATAGLSLGEHPKAMQERLGHSSVTITLDIYSHVTEGVARESADRVAAHILGS